MSYGGSSITDNGTHSGRTTFGAACRQYRRVRGIPRICGRLPCHAPDRDIGDGYGYRTVAVPGLCRFLCDETETAEVFPEPVGAGCICLLDFQE